jgi:hypothetical protein
VTMSRFAIAYLVAAATMVSAQTQQATTRSTGAPAEYRAMFTRYCVSCHMEKLKTPISTPLFFDHVDLDHVSADAEVWERVVRKLAVGAMPPQGAPRPDPMVLNSFRSWLAGELDRAAEAKSNPGRFPLHRLNRAEYANAIRDLFGLKLDITALLPPDSSDFGFDNVASVLSVTPGLLERYLTAAVRISNAAVGEPQPEPVEEKFPVRLDFTQNRHVEGLPLGTRGGTLVHYNFPADGEYVLSASLFRPVDSADTGIEGQDTPNQFEISIDGVRVHVGSIGGPEDHVESRRNLTARRDEVAERMKTRVKVTAGPHDIGFTFVALAARSQDIYELSLRGSQDIHVGSELPKLSSASISGPYKPSGVSDSAVRKRLFVCHPKVVAEETVCARQILSTVAKRAYRRPVTPADLQPVMEFYQQGRKGVDFDAGIRAALPRILTSPSFLFRSESDPSSLPANAAHPVSDLELASRLSFFLWSSIPDDELLNLAAQGRLRGSGNLERQVRRMLLDPRSEALTTNFPDQWLALRNLEKSAPDLLGFPEWDLNLRQALQRETELFFGSIVREDRSALDLLNADYTFVNERTARHYGIPGIKGETFRRVTLDDPNRRGLLGQASILTLTSVATRTSPVFRGKWILTTMLGLPAPIPPPNVPALAENGGNGRPRSVRERLEEHRKSPVCAACHRNIDPLGFSLENFDAVGQWRSTTEAGTPVDSSGVLLDGSPVNGPAALRKVISSRPDAFVGSVTEKLLIYALGRGLETYDMPVVRRIVRDASAKDYRMMSIILGIVESRPFQMRVKSAEGESF